MGMNKRFPVSSQRWRTSLMLGVSGVALTVALNAPQAQAQVSALASTSAAITVPAAQTPLSSSAQSGGSQAAAALRGMVNAQQLSNAAQAALAQQTQAAAQAAAAAATVAVPNGLAIGALQPVANPVSAAASTTGLDVWDGASLPTQTTTAGNTTVTIQQNQARAVLSWETFNIGRDTTLVFDQKQNGVAQTDWVALNRVVGQLDKATGLRDLSKAPAPSQIFGQIKADGQVIVLNANGVVFGGTSQVNLRSLIVSTLEVGRPKDSGAKTQTINGRNSEFLTYGLLGLADQAPAGTSGYFTFSAQLKPDGSSSQERSDDADEISVQRGARIIADDSGYLMFAGPKIRNAGQLTAADGQIILQSGRDITLTRSDGSATSDNPNVRGLISKNQGGEGDRSGYVVNEAFGIIHAPRGNVTLNASTSSLVDSTGAVTVTGAVIQEGLVTATTSVSRNGSITIDAANVRLAAGSVLGVITDSSLETIPQSADSLANFKPSYIEIGLSGSLVEIDGGDAARNLNGALVYAPNATVNIGAAPGLAMPLLGPNSSRIFIGSGATIDVSGVKPLTIASGLTGRILNSDYLYVPFDSVGATDSRRWTDVTLSAARNSIEIAPVKGNELRDTPTYRNSFLNGATIYVDPRVSGTRDDGVAWVGSPLVDAAGYYENLPVGAAELMTSGGNLTLGVKSADVGVDTAVPPDIIIKQGAVLDISGGWVHYNADYVPTTKLVTDSGQLVDIGQANVNQSYVGLEGVLVVKRGRNFTVDLTESYANPLLLSARYEEAYDEGRDAGTLTLKASTVALDGTVYADAFAGLQQKQNSAAGTRTSSIYGDLRALQKTAYQLPSGGYLNIQALGVDSSTNAVKGGGDIVVTSDAIDALNPLLEYGQSVSFDANGNLIAPPRPADSQPLAERLQTIELSDRTLSDMGLSQLSLQTSGSVSLAKDSNLTLQAGGALVINAGRKVTLDGNVSVPAGKITVTTYQDDISKGSIFTTDDDVLNVGDMDIIVNGALSTRGRWTNDYGVALEDVVGQGWLNGGAISLTVAPRIGRDSGDGLTAVDVSGSIHINDGALLDVSAGGYVSPTGKLTLTAKGGDVSLINETTWFQLAGYDPQIPDATGSGFRVGKDADGDGLLDADAQNPDRVNASVSIAKGSIIGQGFSGGGVFTVKTPSFAFGSSTDAAATVLPLDFISASGFASYNITSYNTALQKNSFNGGEGGYNAVLNTQTVTIGAGQTLSLTQSLYPGLALLDAGQTQLLQSLQTGGDLRSILTAAVPLEAWDRKAANLTLGGLIELHVAAGGRIEGDAGAVLGVGKLFNEGDIRLVGGTINQDLLLPNFYVSLTPLAVHSLSGIFTINADGSISGAATSKISGLSNAAVTASRQIYLLGLLDAGEGVRLAGGSVTDLSGASIRNPRTSELNGRALADGRVIAGGKLQTAGKALTTADLFQRPKLGVGSIYDKGVTLTATHNGLTLNAEAGAMLDLSGAADIYDRPAVSGFGYDQVAVWSNAGSLQAGAGGSIAGASVTAQGGAAQAQGGALDWYLPVLAQTDAAQGVQSGISADMIEAAGFDSFTARGGLTVDGDVTLNLGRNLFIVSRNADATNVLADNYPIISVDGIFEVTAPYIRFDSMVQAVSAAAVGTAGDGGAAFHANNIDIKGAVLFDRSLANVAFDASGDLRLIGATPEAQIFSPTSNTPNSLKGQLQVNGDLAITAGQIYPTTGSTFTLASAAADGTISLARALGAAPAAPYSAGGNLTIAAANIVQGGVVRVPVGTLTLAASKSVRLTAGGITSVSAGGLTIPYGATTDQNEYFFTPTTGDELTSLPAASLNINGPTVQMEAGATVDLSGGGDLYAYEFVSGTGGSRDVLDRLNSDAYSSRTGTQYADGRQVYAIVPSQQAAGVALYDPIYSDDYNNLYSAGSAGRDVYLSGGNGVAAGWYTLMPAKYATLTGGMLVVERSGASTIVGTNQKMLDGRLIVSGHYGVAGTSYMESTERSFAVLSQDVINSYSHIVLTSATDKITATAERNNTVAPRLPNDAGRLVVQAEKQLTVLSTLLAAPGAKGRGAEADISGAAFDIVADASATPSDADAIVLSADSLSHLNVASLLIGGTRTNNSDGTTSLDVKASSITLENDSAHPLSAGEIVLATGGALSSLKLADGAAIVASGVDGDLTGDYLVDGPGAIVRVASSGERMATRGTPGATAGLNIGAATLSGNAVLLESSGDFSLSGAARLDASRLALSAGRISFANDATGISGLVITPALQAAMAASDHLTLRTASVIDFTTGVYNFGDLTLDTPGLGLLGVGGGLGINAQALTLSNASGAAGTAGGGQNVLAITASSISFGSGIVHANDFGGGVTLGASGGIGYSGKGGGFDAGAGALTVQTPLIVDVAAAVTQGQPVIIPELALTTAGLLTVVKPSSASSSPQQNIASDNGAPGSVFSLRGDAITIDGAKLIATAGNLSLRADGIINVLNGATLATPGYSKTLGDSADPAVKSAPGGHLSLISVNSDVNVALGSTLSVGGGAGRAGALALSASNGAVNMAGLIDVAAPDGGAGFSLDSGAALDLAAFVHGVGLLFDGGVDIRTGRGDLVLAAGDTLKAGSVKLVADGGSVDIAGQIDTSGVEGGAVELDGAVAVTLRGTARINAHATGYANDVAQVASGGDVTLGTVDAGRIVVENGAIIDVHAARSQGRLIPTVDNGVTTYTYVEPDKGGTVTFRAPVIEQAGADTVNVSFAGRVADIIGASAITVDAVKTYDLADIAANGAYTGVTVYNGNAILDVAQAVSGKANFLSDKAAGTLADYIQNFDISAAYAALGELTSSAAFQARPGVDLAYAGNIQLISNWNLGAGTVDIPSAVAAGLMALYPQSASAKYYVLPGKDAEVFQKYVTMLYRVGGKVDGAAPVLTLQAGGDLTVSNTVAAGTKLGKGTYIPAGTNMPAGTSATGYNTSADIILTQAVTLTTGGKISDGTFTFRNQNDTDYLSYVLGGGYRGTFDPASTLKCSVSGNCAAVRDYTGAVNNVPTQIVNAAIIDASGKFTQIAVSGGGQPIAPFSNSANGAAALANAATGTGDALGSGDLFPMLANGRYAGSSSYVLVAGAKKSADPTRVSPQKPQSLTVAGDSSFTFTASSPTGAFTTSYKVQSFNALNQVSATVSPANLLAQFKSDNNAKDGWATQIDFSASGLTSSIKNWLSDQVVSFFAGKTVTDSTGRTIAPYVRVAGTAARPTRIQTTLKLATDFLNSISIQLGARINASIAPSSSSTPITTATTATARNYIRTGTGDITVKASGNIDLSNGAVRYLTTDGSADPTGTRYQAGGTAIKTLGHIAASQTLSVIDQISGQLFNIDTRSYRALAGGDVFSLRIGTADNEFKYGAVAEESTDQLSAAAAGMQLSNPVYAEGGGDITLDAGNNVTGLRDAWQEARVNTVSSGTNYSFVGASDQAWRTGYVGSTVNGANVTNIRVNQHQFVEGVGTLGGGNIAIKAGGNVSDLTIAATTSVTTGDATAANAKGQTLVTYGGGNISIAAQGSLQGGRIDAGRGAVNIAVGGAVTDGNSTQIFPYGGLTNPPPIQVANQVRLRLSAARVTIEASRSVNLQGITALGVNQQANQATLNLNSRAFYAESAGVSITANGQISISNVGNDVIASSGPGTGYRYVAVYPGTLEATSLTGDLSLVDTQPSPAYAANDTRAKLIVLMPSPSGQLALFAGGDIDPVAISMEDGDPGLLPGIFSIFNANDQAVTSGRGFGFTAILPDTTDVQRRQYHNASPTHANDAIAARIAAGGDINQMILSMAKQTRISAGRDIVDMAFFGQNVNATDVTRIIAGRDITASTALTRPVLAISPSKYGDPLPALQGNIFVIGGPGSLFLEAGRDAGPFLNSAVISSAFYKDQTGTDRTANGTLTYGGGVLSVGNEWNPWLDSTGANLYVEFGVAKGGDYTALRDAYLKDIDPGNAADAGRLADMEDYLFTQQKDSLGNITADRSKPVYVSALIEWMQENAQAELTDAYHTTNVSYQQAYDAFVALPELRQRQFLLDKVYFNELKQTSLPDSGSYLQYSRGYRAVSILFPASLGYTANRLDGGDAGASTKVATGNLDLRLAAIETTRGGNVTILGPGGNILAGSTVRTSEQASRRSYDGGSIFKGDLGAANALSYYPVAISSIPTGYEGILTLRGGFIDSFTDGNLLLNQSRLFTQKGGDIIAWSSNGDLNAGQGPKTSANFSPIQVRIDVDGLAQVDAAGTVSGAGIAAFQPEAGVKAPSVYLIAPRGAVDAGDAGVRVAGSLFVAAQRVINADNFKVSGTTVGFGATAAPNVNTQAGTSAATAAQKAAQDSSGDNNRDNQPIRVRLDLLGYGPSAGGGDDCDDSKNCKKLLKTSQN